MALRLFQKLVKGLGAIVIMALCWLVGPGLLPHTPLSLAMLPSSGALAAPAVSPQMALTRLFTTEALEATWFADGFLAQISLAQIEQILTGITSSLGAYQGIDAVGEDYLLTFERGTVPTRVVLNGAGQITGLLFETPQLTTLSLEDLTQQFAT
ncbi:MAG: hypothetical protein AAFU71_16415, partial [Cyanobacteria bacterium J06632_22]